MKFEWDHDKAQANLKKHRVSFEEAVTVFYDPFAATFPDPDHSMDEDRFITIGYSTENRLLVVCYTERRNKIRVISAWKAGKEKKSYEIEIKRRFGA